MLFSDAALFGRINLTTVFFGVFILKVYNGLPPGQVIGVCNWDLGSTFSEYVIRGTVSLADCRRRSPSSSTSLLSIGICIWDWMTSVGLDISGIWLVVNFSRTFSVPKILSQDFSISASEGLSLPSGLVSPVATRSWSASLEALVDSFLYHTFWPAYKANRLFQVTGTVTEEACCLRAADFPMACLVAGPALHWWGRAWKFLGILPWIIPRVAG